MIALLTSEDLWFRTLQAGTALGLVSLGGYVLWRAGILNIGMEGGMLAGCFGAVLVDDKSHSAWLGLLGGAAFGVAVSLLLGAFAVSWGGHVIIVGLALNFLVAGMTAIGLQAVYHLRGAYTSPNLNTIPRFDIPLVERLPWLGAVISGQSVLTYFAWGLGLFIPWWLLNTRAGLTTRVAGARPDVVEGVGRSVVRAQWNALIFSGILIGLGGAQLALGETAEFAEGMTSGRGFVALALIIVAGRHAALVLPLAISFALFDTLGLTLQTVGLPSELSGVLPYGAILAALIIARLRQITLLFRGAPPA